MRTLLLLTIGLVWCASVAHAEPARFHGRAINDRAIPVPNATVTIRAGAWRTTTTTDEGGRFDVEVPADTVAATLTVAGEFGSTELIAVLRVNVNEDPLQVVLGPVGEATITLLENDAPVPGVRAQILNGSRFSRYVISDVVSDAKGQFTVRLPHRQFTVSITDQRFARDGQNFQVPGAKNKPYREWHPLRLNLSRPRTLVVRVTNADGSIPVGATVLLATSARGSSEPFPNSPKLKTDENGEVTFERLPRRAFYVRAGVDEPRGSAAVQMSPDDEELVIQLESQPVYTLR